MVSFSVRSSQKLSEIAELLGITFVAFPIQPYSRSIFFRKEESKRVEVGSINSRCSGKEPALTQTRHERAAEIELSVEALCIIPFEESRQPSHCLVPSCPLPAPAHTFFLTPSLPVELWKACGGGSYRLGHFHLPRKHNRKWKRITYLTIG